MRLSVQEDPDTFNILPFLLVATDEDCFAIVLGWLTFGLVLSFER